MKKSILLASLLAVVALTACGKKEEVVAPVATPAPEASAPAMEASAPAMEASAAAADAAAPASAASNKDVHSSRESRKGSPLRHFLFLHPCLLLPASLARSSPDAGIRVEFAEHRPSEYARSIETNPRQ